MSAGEWLEMALSSKCEPGYQIDLDLVDNRIVNTAGTWTATVDYQKLPGWNEPRAILVVFGGMFFTKEQQRPKIYRFSGFYENNIGIKVAAVYREGFFSNRRVVISYARDVCYCGRNFFVEPVLP